MKDVGGNGRTVLFVSHNMAAVKSLCTKGIVLEHGKVVFKGESNAAVDYYLEKQKISTTNLEDRTDREGNQKIKFTNIEIENSKGNIVEQIFVGEATKFKFTFKENEKIDWSKFIMSVIFYDLNDNIMCSFPSDEMGQVFKQTNNNQIVLNIPFMGLRASVYSVSIYSFVADTNKDSALDIINNASIFEVLTEDFYNSGKLLRSQNCAFLKSNYE